MGAGNFRIIMQGASGGGKNFPHHMELPLQWEPSLGYSAMAGTVGGGGLGDIAIRYGYHRYQADIMIVTVVLLIVLVQIFQMIGTTLANRLDKRR